MAFVNLVFDKPDQMIRIFPDARADVQALFMGHSHGWVSGWGGG